MVTILKLIFICMIFLSITGQAQLVKRIDTIENNSQTNILLKPNGGEVRHDYVTADTIPYHNATKGLVSTGVTKTVFDYLTNVTSDIQTQINSKLTDALTTDGDVFIRNTTTTRLGIGTAGQILTVTAGLPAWADAPVSSPLTTNGDLYYYNTIDARLPIGTAGKVLTVTAGLPAWETPAASVETVVTKATSTTLATTGEEIVICDPTSGAVTLTLPTAVGNKDLKYAITMKNEIDKCIIDGAGTETIGGPLTRELYETNNSITIVSDNANWFILERTATIAVQGAGNGGTVLTANTTNIDFTEVRDKTQSYNGTQFTAPEGGTYCASGVIQLTSNTGLLIKAYINAAFSRRAGFVRGTTNSNALFNYCNFLNQGDVLSFRSDTNVTLSATSTDHWLSISRVD